MARPRKYKDEKTSLKAKYRCVNASNKALRVGISFRLDKEKDKTLIEYIAQQPDKVGFFRKLIREDMDKNKSTH